MVGQNIRKPVSSLAHSLNLKNLEKSTFTRVFIQKQASMKMRIQEMSIIHASH